MIIDVIYFAMLFSMISCMTWRIICLFRKKGSCKFRRCPFRKNYTSMSCIYFPSGGCTKCPPTLKELEIYRHTPEGIIENIMKDEKRN